MYEYYNYCVLSYKKEQKTKKGNRVGEVANKLS